MPVKQKSRGKFTGRRLNYSCVNKIQFFRYCMFCDVACVGAAIETSSTAAHRQSERQTSSSSSEISVDDDEDVHETYSDRYVLRTRVCT